MERQPVTSSLIRSVGYDAAGSILEIELVEPNRVYAFYDVPYSVYDELMEAPSKGTFFNDFIRDLYAYQEIIDVSLPDEDEPPPVDVAATDRPESFPDDQGPSPTTSREP
jgi:KTSC domain